MPLGPRRLFWLTVQLANAAGWGKLSLQERVRRVDQHMYHIRASASSPLAAVATSPTGQVASGWWRTAQSPWPCLAAVFELSAALLFTERGGRIEEFMSRLPVMLDGWVLQRAAALCGTDVGCPK